MPNCVLCSFQHTNSVIFAEMIQKVSPLLHHFAAFAQMGSAIIGAPIRVTNCVSELMLDVVGANMQNFVKDCPRHCPEAVTGHFFLANSHSTQG